MLIRMTLSFSKVLERFQEKGARFSVRKRDQTRNLEHFHDSINLGNALALCAMVFLAACTTDKSMSVATVDETVDPWLLNIKIGRMGAMLSNGERALDLLNKTGWTDSRSNENDPEEIRKEYFLRLYRTVLEYNELQLEACATGLVNSELCVAPYFPDWLHVSAESPPSLQELDTWSEELWPKINFLSGDLCEQGMKKTGDHLFCSIE